MAGDWIKVEKAAARKPEVLRLADILGVHPDHAFGLCVRFWFWCDDQLVDGHAPSVTYVTLDSVVGHDGFAEALTKVGWLSQINRAMVVPNFDRHLSLSAKNRALSVERKRKERGSNVTVLSRDERDNDVTREEREESEREIPSLNSDREANGSARTTGTPPPADHALLRSRKYFVPREGRTIANLDDLDWSKVCAMAEAVAKRVAPRTTDDRRQWLRYAVMAETAMSEDWLVGAAESVVNAKQTRRTKQAHFVGVLKARAADSGYDSDTFLSMLGSIEIPKDVWKSSVLEIRK